MAKRINDCAPASTRQRVQFSFCPYCGTEEVPLVSCEPVSVQVDDGTPQIIPRGKNAGLLRSLPSYASGEAVVAQQISKALGGSGKVSQMLAMLRNTSGIPILCDLVPKVTERGVYGLYYHDPKVRVLELEGDGQ